MGIGSRRRAVCPVPQNAPCMNAGMNPVRLWPGFGLRSYGVNVLNSLQGQRPKAREVSPWYGVCTMNQQLTRSTLTNLRSIYRQLLQHQHGMA